MAHSQNLKKLKRADFGQIIPDHIKNQQLTRDNTNQPTDVTTTNQDTVTPLRKSSRINDPNYIHNIIGK